MYNTIKLITDVDFDAICDVELRIDGVLIHKGITDIAEVTSFPKFRALKIASRGFTSLLSQSEIKEGILSSPSLNSLLSVTTDIPNINHENSSATVNYIYVKNHSSVWDMAVNLCLKIYGKYPYIAHVNMLRYTIPAETMLVEPEAENSVVSYGTGADYRSAVSNFYMLDTDDTYSFELEDSEVTGLGIVRQKYLPLDKQWLNNTQAGLQYRDNFGMRGSDYSFVSYRGYHGEDINDRATFADTVNKRISRIVLVGGKNGLTTRLWCYSDRYNNV